MALIAALLSTTIILALGIAVVMSASSDVGTTKIQRVGEQAFFAADAGLDVARRALAQAISEKIVEVQLGAVPYYRNNAPLQTGQFRDLQVIPPLDGTWNSTFYQAIRDRAVSLATAANRATRLSQLNGTSYTVQYAPFTGSINLNAADAYNAVEVDVIRYSIQVTGQASGGGSATVHETGRLAFNITLLASGGPGTRNFKFSGFGAFFDNGDTQAGAPLASGTFSGPVHTNSHFAFLSNRNVTFRNVVSQVDNLIRYDDTSSTTPNHAIPTADITGIDISSEGYKKIPAVPLPANNFSQEYAVINSTGITDKRSDGTPVDPPSVIPKDGSGNDVAVFDSSGRVTADVLAANLRTASNKNPTVTSGILATGVYVSSGDGSTVTGAGIYVQGDVEDMQIYADTSNGDQYYVITQGGVATTVRTSYTNNTTTISRSGKTATFTGVFTDKTDPTNIQTGTSLFVNGSISSLRGGAVGSSVVPAIAANTRLTLTAQRNITVTGDLKYTNQVANLDGTSVSNINSIKNVFGIFTNDGNLNLAPNDNYVSGSGLSMEINAAVVTFNSNTSNDPTNTIEGSITYTGGTTPGTNDRWRLVGSRVQSKINNIGYNYRDLFFDQRYSGGSFSPPFFPGTSYSLVPAVPAVVNIVATDAPFPTAMSWFRDNN